MMRKLKKISAIVFASLFTLMIGISVSACQSMEDIVPEKYGEWDGNYIYRGNGRAKTTAEDYKQLVQNVELFGESYTVLDCVDFEIKGDDMYLILKCDYPNILEDIYCVVKYDIKNKTQTLLTHDITLTNEGTEFYYRPIEIEGIYEDCVLLQANVIKAEYLKPNIINWENGWYKVDLSNFSEEAVEEDFSNYVWASDECLIAEKYNSSMQKYELYYRKGHFSEEVCISDVLDDFKFSEWTYIERNGVKGILFETYGNRSYDYSSDGRSLSNIKFYNLKTNIMSDRIYIGDVYATWCGDKEYLKTYNLMTVEYNRTWWRFEKKTGKMEYYKKETGNIEYNNKIERLVIDENGIRLEPFYDLPEKYGYNMIGVLENKMVYREYWYESARGCGFGGKDWKYYEHDLSTDKKREINNKEVFALEDEYAISSELKKGVTFGDYTYFLHKESVFGSGLVYMLKRYNTKTQEIEVMQLWYGTPRDPRDSRRQEYEKFSDALWFTPTPLAHEIERYDFYEFAVRNY